jgi:hypothetical protein
MKRVGAAPSRMQDARMLHRSASEKNKLEDIKLCGAYRFYTLTQFDCQYKYMHSDLDSLHVER